MTGFQTAKLRVGDKVVMNLRAPRWLMAELNRPGRSRTVVGVIYDPTRQCNFYMLGHKAGHPHDVGGYGFRSYQLKLYCPGSLRRPRIRRAYRATATPSVDMVCRRRSGMIVVPLPM